MKFFFLIFTCFIQTSWSNEILMTVNAEGNLLLSASNCAELFKQEQSICQWKKQVEPNFVIPILSSNKNRCTKAKAKNKFNLLVSDCIPEFAKDYANKNIVHDGPNCWGTAMNFHEFSSKPRFFWTEEMRYWLEETPLCRKLNPGEKKLPGDIINVYGPEYLFEYEVGEQGPGLQFWDAIHPTRSRSVTSEQAQRYSGFHRFLHSETYVSDLIAFGKDSPSKLDKFNFRPMKEVYGRPRDEAECQENQEISPHFREFENSPKNIKGSKCSYFTQVVRCGNANEYFEAQDLSETEKEILTKIKSIQGLQEQLYALIFTKKRSLLQCEVDLITASSDINALLALEALKLRPKSKNEEMLRALEFFTAAGVRKSLEFAELIPEKK